MEFLNTACGGRFFLNSDMTILEKIAKGRDKTIFTLHREGLFYRCYNEDAMVFSKQKQFGL